MDLLCPDKGTMVQWKGAKVSKLMFHSEKGAMLRVNFFNNSPNYDLMSQEYVGFLAFTKKNCGRNFTDALVDGRVKLVKDYQKLKYIQLNIRFFWDFIFSQLWRS